MLFRSSYWSSKKEGSCGPGGSMLYWIFGDMRSAIGSQTTNENDDKLTLNVYRSLGRVIVVSLENKEERAPYR